MFLFETKQISINDIEYVANIMQKRWETSIEWARKETKKYLANDATCAGFCVFCKEKIVGVGLFSLKNDDVSTDYGPWLYLLWIDKKYRGNDLGIELTKKRMEHARKHGYKEIYLDTTDAVDYHHKLGWEDVCVVNYEGEIDYIMRFDLSKEFPFKHT